jgi:hypothetical protein
MIPEGPQEKFWHRIGSLHFVKMEAPLKMALHKTLEKAFKGLQ